jgi:hypothetical protein
VFLTDNDRRGKRYLTRLQGRDVIVVAEEIEQRPYHRHRGKWVVRNEATGYPLHRSIRQLRAIIEEPEERARECS